MNYLLDTHVLLWWLYDELKLSLLTHDKKLVTIHPRCHTVACPYLYTQVCKFKLSCLFASPEGEAAA